MHTARSSVSLFFFYAFTSRSLTLCFSLFRASSSSPVCSSEAECVPAPRSLPFFSFPTVFLPLPLPQRSNPTSFLPTSSFSSATLPSLPHFLFSYQPGRSRIHILQAFMMAAAHLCEPAWLGLPLACLGHRLAPFEREQYRSIRANPTLSSLFLFSVAASYHAFLRIINCVQFYSL